LDFDKVFEARSHCSPTILQVLVLAPFFVFDKIEHLLLDCTYTSSGGRPIDSFKEMRLHCHRLAAQITYTGRYDKHPFRTVVVVVTYCGYDPGVGE
jgi:hypothetical protein